MPATIMVTSLGVGAVRMLEEIFDEAVGRIGDALDDLEPALVEEPVRGVAHDALERALLGVGGGTGRQRVRDDTISLVVANFDALCAQVIRDLGRKTAVRMRTHGYCCGAVGVGSGLGAGPAAGAVPPAAAACEAACACMTFVSPYSFLARSMRSVADASL